MCVGIKHVDQEVPEVKKTPRHIRARNRREPMNIAAEENQILFDTDFECANADHVRRVSKNEY